MIRLLQRRDNEARSELDEVKKMLLRLRSSPARTRSAVGAGVCLANNEFLRQFEGIQSFRQIPARDREQFYARLSDLESSLRNQEVGIVLGVGLYRVWLADMLAGHREAAEILGRELTELSRNASFIYPPERRT